jgi:hypothetical protein
MSPLLDLADTVEALSKPCIKTEMAIARFFEPDPRRDRQNFPIFQGGLRRCTQSLDAAMTLVPTGWDWWAGSKSQGGLYRISLHGPVQSGNVCDMTAATNASRAIALTAAALRAWASALPPHDRTTEGTGR